MLRMKRNMLRFRYGKNATKSKMLRMLRFVGPLSISAMEMAAFGARARAGAVRSCSIRGAAYD